jgi:DNA-binding beta-propeller fold protein YncE
VRDADDDDAPRATAMSDRSEADDPEEMEGLTRELWAFARGTPFEEAVRHAERSEARYAAEPAVVTLPTGWRLAPAGTQVEVGRLPYEAVPFAGRLVVLNNGYYHAPDENPVVTIVDPARSRVESEIRLPSLFPSAAVASGGALFVSGGSSDSIFQLNVRFDRVRAFAAGGYVGPIVAVDSTHLAVALLTAPDSAGSTSAGTLALLNTTTGQLGPTVPAGYFPIAMRVAGGKLYLALAGENGVAVYDLAGGTPRRRGVVPTGRSPQALCDDGERLYVVDSGSDDVAAVSLASDSVVARYPVRFPGPAGETVRFGSAPTSCAVSGERLYVTAAGMNAMAVFDRAAPSGSAPRGMVPTAWYPTKVVADGGRILVLSAKGVHARRPNPNGPQAPTPLRHSGPDYVLTLLRGSVGILADSAVAPRLAGWTRQVAEGAPLFSSVEGFRLPIRHIFYVVRENRSYDQVMGDLNRGDGDSTLTLFGQRVTPVGHQIARGFVTLDRFFADGEISVLGHSFTTSGYASPFLEWLGNTSYAGRYRGYPFGTVPGAYSPAYLWDGLEAKSVPYRIYGEPYYLFTRLYRLITDRYGAQSPLARRFYARSLVLADSTDRGQRFTALATPYIGRATSPSDALRVLENPDFVAGISRLFTGDASLATAIAQDNDFRIGVATWLSHYAFGYPTWNLKFSDLDRIAIWRRDFEAALAEGRVATFNHLWLPNDHTAGANSDFLNPFQLVAQNDAALGQLVETISRSPIWKESLIVVEEDDAQNGPDHIDATRTVALLAGPWVRRGAVVSDRFDQLSALRTVELLLGLDPLNLGDAVAAPMFSAFTTRPDTRPFRPVSPSSYLVAADSARLEALQRAE